MVNMLPALYRKGRSLSRRDARLSHVIAAPLAPWLTIPLINKQAAACQKGDC